MARATRVRLSSGVKPSPSPRIILRYSLLQLPGIALLIIILFLLEQWLDLPLWLQVGVLLFWIAKDVLLFPFVWQAYDWEGITAHHSMLGRRGTAKEQLSPAGYVQIGNETWRAERVSNSPPIQAGDSIYVREMRGLTLLVERDDTLP